jgi:hypothetical protein
VLPIVTVSYTNTHAYLNTYINKYVNREICTLYDLDMKGSGEEALTRMTLLQPVVTCHELLSAN